MFSTECLEKVGLEKKCSGEKLSSIQRLNSIHIDQGPELQCLLKVKEDLS